MDARLASNEIQLDPTGAKAGAGGLRVHAHVEDVKLRIEGRFGRPQSVSGREQSGPYHAIWRLPDQMEIFVAREWPQKTTQLRFTNLPV